MNGSSMKDIKLRIKSVESTRQITKAMQLVATSKMRRSKERMERSKPYSRISMQAFATALRGCKSEQVMFVTPREVKRRLYIVVAGDRGLAGGYNNNIYKAVAAHAGSVPFDVLPVGRKALEKYRNNGVNVLSGDFQPVADMKVGTCYRMSSLVCSGYRNGDFDEVYIAYTDFKSMLTQEATVKKLLPIESMDKEACAKCEPVYEPDAQTMVETIVPDLIAGQIFGCVCNAGASENAARRNAMDSATKNADEMISNLNLSYNRARQGSITQEITEIVAGAEK